MVAIVEKHDLVRPFRLRKISQALDVRAPLPVRQKTQHVRNFQRVVEFSFFHVRLPENGQRRSFLRFKQPFHRRQGWLLIVRNQFSLHVPGREELQDCRSRPYQNSCPHKRAAVVLMPLRQQIKGAYSCHDEAAGLHRPQHVVCVLPQRPLV